MSEQAGDEDLSFVHEVLSSGDVTMSRKSAAPAERKRPAADASALPLDRAKAAFAAARFAEASAILEFSRPPTAADRGLGELLAARIAHYNGDEETSLNEATAALKSLAAPADRALAAALAGTAARRLGKDEVAEKHFAALTGAVPPPAAYLVAVDAFERGDDDAAESVATQALSRKASDPDLLSLLGRIAVRRERTREASAHFTAALTALEERPSTDAFREAETIVELATIAADLADIRLGKRVRRIHEEFAWTEALAAQRFAAVSQLRLISMLEGDFDRAWVEAREATQLAAGPAASVLAETGAGVASRLLGDAHASRLQFQRAWETIRAAKLGAASDEERVALVTFAADAAREMPAEARQALTMQRMVRTKRGRPGAGEPRDPLEALATFAAARIDEAAGDRFAAIDKYREALDFYDGFGSNLRKGIVAADLYRLTRNTEYSAVLEEVLRRAPHAWLKPEPSPADELGPKAREILARLLVGESAKSVAADLGRSTFTVSNHTRRIFAVFGVHSRDALREECAKLGITPATLRR